jgi:hypothetical protein
MCSYLCLGGFGLTARRRARRRARSNGAQPRRWRHGAQRSGGVSGGF